MSSGNTKTAAKTGPISRIETRLNATGTARGDLFDDAGLGAARPFGSQKRTKTKTRGVKTAVGKQRTKKATNMHPKENKNKTTRGVKLGDTKTHGENMLQTAASYDATRGGGRREHGGPPPGIPRREEVRQVVRRALLRLPRPQARRAGRR